MSQKSQYKTIGVWMSAKKCRKLNWKAFIKSCNTHGYRLVKLDLEKPLEEQGDLDVLLHKLTDIIASSDQGDTKAMHFISRVEQYLSNHTNITVIDPLDNVRILLNRYCYYSILQEEFSAKEHGIFTPNFAEFKINDVNVNIKLLKQRNVRFPVICKPTVAHGSKSAHNMIVVFNERDLNVCKPPCVVQSFVNHNAILHKVFLVGNRYVICQRPSLKNFYASGNLSPIFYSTGEVCKADSQSTLSILDPQDQSDKRMLLDEEKIKNVINVLKWRINLALAGFDVVLDNLTGDHAVIDINVFPSYDNFPNFFEHLLDTIEEATKKTDSLRSEDFSNHSVNGFVNIAKSTVDCDIMGMNVD